MDPIESIKIHKDSTFAMMLEAQRRNLALWYLSPGDLMLIDGQCWSRQRMIQVTDDSASWFRFTEERFSPLSELDVILMRKDPPFDLNYISLTWMLELAANEGTLVVNPPQALRDFNEKLAISLFPQFCVPSLVSQSVAQLKRFLNEQRSIIVKPIDSMGGDSIFRLEAGEGNVNVILETITQRQQRVIMAQQFIPEIRAGDKRILIVDGEPVPYSLARVPPEDDFRGNLATGGSGVGQPLSDRDWEIARHIGKFLRKKGILFAGIDVIGDYLTEINITSPTCIRELDAQYGLNISAKLFDAIEEKCLNRT